MSFNYISFIQTCFESVSDVGLTSLVYYSHIPAALVSLFLGFFILLKNKNIISKIIFSIAFLFCLWSVIDIFLWLGLNSKNYVFLWSLTVMLETLIFILSIYLINVFTINRDISFKIKFLLFLPLVPILILTNTVFNIGYFNILECVPIDNVLYPLYALPLRGILALFLIINFIYLLKKIDKEKRIQLILIFLGLFFFLISFFGSNYLVNYLINSEIMAYGDAYKIEMYSLFAFPVFLSVLTFIIVRFRVFNIKLLGAQALVLALIVLIGAQFLYVKDMPITSLALTWVTFVLSVIIGVLVIRSVKKLDHQKDLLAEANNNQQSLLHFITHQVKGYMTKTRNIFDAMLAGDYGDLPEKAKEMAHYGFDSETRGVETVQAILKASDLKSGRTEFKKEKTNLSALVAEVVDFRKDVAVGKGIELTFDIEPNIMTQVDPVHIKEVFKNIISNAITYTPEGTVHVLLKKEIGKIHFAVIDTGFGLSKEDKVKLFTEGGKGTDSLAINVDSTGYGLYIAKKIVHQHNGVIGAKSEGRGKGSEFFVILPDVG